MSSWRATLVATAAVALFTTTVAAQDANPGTAANTETGATPPEQGSPQQQPTTGTGPAVMLDIEGFSQALYERGFRQGYIRGIADARARFLQEMARMNQARPDNAQSDGSGQPNDGDAAPQAQTAEQGAVIVLPPGMTPELFMQRVQEMNEAAQNSATPSETPADAQ